MANTLIPQTAQAPASNTAAVCTLAVPAITTTSQRWRIKQISWSYSGTPTGGSIVIAWGTVSMTYYVVAGGPGQLMFNPPLMIPPDVAVTVTLAAGGSGITGTVYAEADTDIS